MPPNSSIKSATYASDLFFSETVAMAFGGAFLVPQAARAGASSSGRRPYSPRDERGGGDLGGNALVATAEHATRASWRPSSWTFMTEQDAMRRLLRHLEPAADPRGPRRARASSSPCDPSCPRCSSARPPPCGPQDAAQVASPSMAAINTVLSDQLEAAFVGGQSTDDTLAGISDGHRRRRCR